MTCKECNELMAEAYYRELETSKTAEFETHLEGCRSCSEQFARLKETLALMSRRERVELSDEEWTRFTGELDERLETSDREARTNVSLRRPAAWRPAGIPAWAYGIAATVLIGFGIYLGRTFFNGQDAPVNPPMIEQASDQAPQDSVAMQALSYLERSKNLLLGVVNSPESRLPHDFPRKQEASRQLVDEANYLKAALSRPDQQRVRQLVLDLEIILVQLANIEVKPGMPAVELVKRGVDRKSILLKINLEEMRAMARRSTPREKNQKNSL